MLARMLGVDDALQERLEKAMETYDHARGVYLSVLADIRATGVSWEDLTDLTGCTVEEIQRDLAHWEHCKRLAAMVP